MAVPIFFSRPNPATRNQEMFVGELADQLRGIGLEPRTLGVGEYSVDAPLSTVRILMSESNGLVVVACRRYRSENLFRLVLGDDGADGEVGLERKYLTSPWCQIEPGMAFQLGLPILLIRERGVLADGVLEQGVVGLYMPEVDIEGDPSKYLQSHEWKSLLHEFGSRARTYRIQRGRP
jgi:hypothetical protein